MSSKYLDQFPEEFHTFIINRFSQAYVFAEQGYRYGSDDVISLAPGPRTMKERVADSCDQLLGTASAGDREILQRIIDTVDESDDLVLQVKESVDRIWKEGREYIVSHPPKPKTEVVEPPSAGQLGFLKTLKCPIIPTSKTKASELITKYKNESRRIRR